MPKPKIYTESDFTPEAYAAIPRVKGKPLSEKDLKRNQDIQSLGREIVKLVQEGKLDLDKSKVVDDVLFIHAGGEYYVLAPNKGVQMSDEAKINAERWPYQGLVSNLERLHKTLKSWKKLAKK